jgi:hypothetical protein
MSINMASSIETGILERAAKDGGLFTKKKTL